MRKINYKLSRKGQIWVETVVYTLIGLALLGTLLAFAVPEIQKQKDKAVISNTINALSELDNNIVDVRRNGAGNVREMSFLINRGTLTVDSLNDSIYFVIGDSSYVYSEMGHDVLLSGTNLKVLTEKNGKKNKVTLTLDYRSGTKTNITFNEIDSGKTLTPASVSYSLVVQNFGRGNINDPASVTNVDISEQ